MNRVGAVWMKERLAGKVWQDEQGYWFQYDPQYLNCEAPEPISLTLPLQPQPYHRTTMIPFFDGLIPEGWLLDVAVRNWKLNPRDRMGLLLSVCRDCIGAISVIAIEDSIE